MFGEKIDFTKETDRPNFENKNIGINQLNKYGLGVFIAAINPGVEVVVDGVHSTFDYHEDEDNLRLEQHFNASDLSTKIITDNPESFRCPKDFIIANGRLKGIIHHTENDLKTKLAIPFYHKDGTRYQEEEFTKKEGDVGIDKLDKDELGVFIAVSNPGTDVVIHGLHNTMEWDDEESCRPAYVQQRLHELDTSNRIITDDIEGFRCPEGFVIADGSLEGITQSISGGTKIKWDIPFFHTDGTRY